MDMEPLWDWERERGANADELAPVHSMETKETEKLAVVKIWVSLPLADEPFTRLPEKCGRNVLC